MTGQPFAAVVALVLAGAGCMVGPNYRRPDVVTPPSWGELAPTAPPAGRSDAVVDGSPTAWWTTFDDALLTSLIQRTVDANLTLQQAEARVREARASRRIAASGLWPHVEAAGSYTRERTSKNGISAALAREAQERRSISSRRDSTPTGSWMSLGVSGDPWKPQTPASRRRKKTGMRCSSPSWPRWASIT